MMQTAAIKVIAILTTNLVTLKENTLHCCLSVQSVHDIVWNYQKKIVLLRLLIGKLPKLMNQVLERGMQSSQPHDMQPSETYQKNEWDGGLQAWDMLMEIKYCGSSTVTNNKQNIHKSNGNWHI